jgi:hypothetical protein
MRGFRVQGIEMALAKSTLKLLITVLRFEKKKDCEQEDAS